MGSSAACTKLLIQPAPPVATCIEPCGTPSNTPLPSRAGGMVSGGPSPPWRRTGGPPETIPPALDGSGVLEGVPHGSMHVATGGAGWMSNFVQAALDPIFWLHHCNIDRLWEVWIQRDPRNKNPDDPAWLDASFSFHDATGGNGNLTPRQVLQTRKAPLSYEYDDTTDPLAK